MIIAFIFILVGIIFMIGTLIYTRKKNNLQEVKPIDKSNIKKGKKTLSNLWGIDGFNNQVITINKNQHSIIIELESIEYSLLHDGEKANVDRELISIAQMLKFPIQFLEVKKQAFDYIFMDPPYGKLLEKEAVLYLDGSVLCDENTTIIIESDLDTEFSWVMDTGFTITKEKIYKTNKHTFLQRK